MDIHYCVDGIIDTNKPPSCTDLCCVNVPTVA